MSNKIILALFLTVAVFCICSVGAQAPEDLGQEVYLGGPCPHESPDDPNVVCSNSCKAAGHAIGKCKNGGCWCRAWAPHIIMKEPFPGF